MCSKVQNWISGVSTTSYEGAAGAVVKNAGALAEISLQYEAGLHLLWVTLKSPGAIITPVLLNEIIKVQKAVQNSVRPELHIYSDQGQDSFTNNGAIRFVAYRSAHPQYFLLGGDLQHFLNWVENNDRTATFAYAHNCVEVCANNIELLGGHVLPLASVHGEAPGGGFEAAMSCARIYCQSNAIFQLPEMYFSLFPALAYSLVGRRSSLSFVHELVTSCRKLTASDALDAGLIDGVSEKLADEDIRKFVREFSASHGSLCSTAKIMNRLGNVTREEMRFAADIWAEQVFSLGPRQISRIKRTIHIQHKLNEMINVVKG